MIKFTLGRVAQISVAVGATALLAACGDQTAEQPAVPAEPAAVTQPAEPAVAAAATPITGPWASLQPAIGQYPSQSGILENSPLADPLKTLLGDKFAAFKTNLQVESPLQQDGDVLYLSGNKQHEGGSEAAYLLADTKTRALEVGLWQAGKLEVFKTPGSDIRKPTDIQTMISNAAG